MATINADNPNYVTADEFRTFVPLASGEYSDARINSLISGCTAQIQDLTNRYWGGEATMSGEFYNGTGERILRLNRPDIHAIQSLAIDDDEDNTFTSITTTEVEIMDEGMIRLTNDAEVSTFTKGFRNVSMSYTYGATASGASVPEDIKRLTMLMAADTLEPNPSFQKEINLKLNKLKDIGAALA